MTLSFSRLAMSDRFISFQGHGRDDCQSAWPGHGTHRLSDFKNNQENADEQQNPAHTDNDPGGFLATVTRYMKTVTITSKPSASMTFSGN